jgi:hypothetical protein
MNIRNLIAKVALITALLMLALPAAAQDALPLPRSEPAVLRALTAEPISPIASATLAKSQVMEWSHYGAQIYKIKYRIVATGEVIKWNPSSVMTCINQKCSAIVPVELLLAAKHEQVIKWRVISNLDSVKYRSAAALAVINEGPVAQAISPQHGASIKYYNLLNYEWVGSFKGLNYTFKLFDASGTQIFTYTGSAFEMCGLNHPDYCSFPHSTYLQSLMIPSLTYSWRIDTKTATETALKSPLWTFTYAL